MFLKNLKPKIHLILILKRYFRKYIFGSVSCDLIFKYLTSEHETYSFKFTNYKCIKCNLIYSSYNLVQKRLNIRRIILCFYSLQNVTLLETHNKVIKKEHVLTYPPSVLKFWFATMYMTIKNKITSSIHSSLKYSFFFCLLKNFWQRQGFMFDQTELFFKRMSCGWWRESLLSDFIVIFWSLWINGWQQNRILLTDSNILLFHRI